MIISSYLPNSRCDGADSPRQRHLGALDWPAAPAAGSGLRDGVDQHGLVTSLCDPHPSVTATPVNRRRHLRASRLFAIPRTAVMLAGGEPVTTIDDRSRLRAVAYEGLEAMGTPTPTTADLVEATTDLSAMMRRRLNAEHGGLIAEMERVHRLAQQCDEARKSAIALLNTGTISPWRQRQQRELHQQFEMSKATAARAANSAAVSVREDKT